MVKYLRPNIASNLATKAYLSRSQKDELNLISAGKTTKDNLLSVWESYSNFKSLSTVIRSGFGLYGIYPYNPSDKSPKPESDLEHTAGMVILIQLLSIYFPEIIPKTQLNDYIFGAEIHELGEILTGDIPDDGNRNEQEKDCIEKQAISNFLSNLPEPYRSKGELLFEDFQKRSTTFGQILYCIDKTEAVLQGLVYEKSGHPGLLTFKTNCSPADKEYAKKTSSNNLVDIFALSFFEKAKNYTNAIFFAKLIDVAVRNVRGRPFVWPYSTMNHIKPIQF